MASSKSDVLPLPVGLATCQTSDERRATSDERRVCEGDGDAVLFWGWPTYRCRVTRMIQALKAVCLDTIKVTKRKYIAEDGGQRTQGG